MSHVRHLLEKTKSILIKNAKNPNAPITIREIIAKSEGMIGEFHMNSSKSELECALIRRIVNQIGQFLEGAKKIHIRFEFDPSTLKIKAGCENHITRFAYNEFGHYPSEGVGPISMKGFASIINRLKGLGKSMPENLHVLVSSIPVKNEKNEVYNLICYLQCGAHPIIDVRAKATPAVKDFTYPGTSNARIFSGSDSYLLLKEIKQFLSKAAFLKDSQKIKSFMKEGLYNPDFKAPQKLHSLLLMQLNLLLKNNLEKIKLNAIEIKKTLNEFKNEIETKSKLLDGYYSKDQKFPYATLGNHIGETGFYYGKPIKIKTAGGEECEVCIDICMDNEFKVAKNAFLDEIKYNRFSLFASQMLTASTTVLKRDSTLGERVTQADSSANRVGVRKVKENKKIRPFFIGHCENHYFGVSTSMSFMNPEAVTSVAEKTVELIQLHNDLSLTLQAHQIVAVQYPYETNHVVTSLIHAIANAACDHFYHIHNIDYAYEPIKKCLVPLLEKEIIKSKAYYESELLKFSYLGDTVMEWSNAIFYYVIYDNHFEILRSFLNIGINPNAQSSNGHTLLTAAVKNNRMEMAALLLRRHNTNPNLTNGQGETPLSIAISNENGEMVKLILNNRKTQFDSCFMRYLAKAVYNENHEMVILLLENAKSVKKVQGNTALHIASELGLYNVIEFLLKHEANPGINNANNETAADIAKKQGWSQIGNLLGTAILDTSVSIDKRPQHGI